MGFSHQVVVEDGNGDRGIRIPDKALQELLTRQSNTPNHAA